MKKAFTLTELLVVVAIITILASILFPVFAKAKSAAVSTSCLSNLKQIGLAWMLYANDSDDRACPSYYFSPDFSKETAWDFSLDYSTGSTGPGLVQGYAKSGEINRCPGFRGESWGRPFTGYGYNASYVGGDTDGRLPAVMTDFREPAQIVVFADSGFGEPVMGSNFLRAPSDSLFNYGMAHFRHSGGANAFWLDGHAKLARGKFCPEGELGAFSVDDSAYGM